MSLASQSSHSWQTHTYAEKNGVKIELDYLPSLQDKESKVPFFFLIHGGAFVSGNRKLWDPWIVGLAREMKFAFVSIDYRLCPEVALSESVHDVHDAWKYVTGGRLDPSLDPMRGIVAAISAGGYFLMHAGASFEPRPFALLDVYGIPSMSGEALNEKNSTLPEAMTTLDPLFEMTGEALTTAFAAQKPVTGSYMDFCSVLGITKDAWLQVGLKNGFTEHEWTDIVGMGTAMTLTDALRAKMSPYALYNGLIGRVVSADGREVIDEEDALADREPFKRIDGTFPPFCSLHGDSDVFVPYKYKAELVAHLGSIVTGRRSPKFITVAGGDHMMDVTWDVETSQVRQVHQWLSSLF